MGGRCKDGGREERREGEMKDKIMRQEREGENGEGKMGRGLEGG